MPTKLINTSLSGIAQGVSQQYEEGRFDSQVTDMINCIPSITRGVLRRNPIKAVRQLSELPIGIEECFTYSYDRGTDGEQYLIAIPGNGDMYVFNINDGSLVHKETGNTYLTIDATKHVPSRSFSCITLGDHTFVVNKTITVEWDKTYKSSTSGYGDMAFYWIKKTTSVVTEQKQTGTDPVLSGSLSVGYTYQLNNCKITGKTDSRPGEVPLSLNTAFEIAHEFQNNNLTPGQESYANSFDKAFAYFVETTTPLKDWVWEDTFGNQASLGVWKTVNDSSELPATLPIGLDGFIVRIQGSQSTDVDDYFLKYNYAAKTWSEVPGIIETKQLDGTFVYDGIYTRIAGNTMPHVLYRMADGTFQFGEYVELSADGLSLTTTSKWGELVSGGLDPLHSPSFIGEKIVSMFFYKNRTGLLTNDSIILSSNGDYGNFFPQTVTEVFPDDPIDLSVASTDVTVLRHAVPTAGQLAVFSDDTQFILDSLDGSLTPNTADITAISHYTYGSNADAVGVGNRLLFSNQAGGYSQIFGYRIGSKNTIVSEGYPLTIHLPSYIDASIDRIIGHASLGQVFMLETANPTNIIVLTTVQRGKEDLQNAFHKWEFKIGITNIHIINNSLYILFYDGSLVQMSLEVPGDIRNVTYLDEYIQGTLEPFESSIVFSKFYFRDSSHKGTRRGRYQLRTAKYTLGAYSHYKTEVTDTSYSKYESIPIFGATWNDTDSWDDSLIWTEAPVAYTREYYDDDKVTLLVNNENALIKFKNNDKLPSEGFELATLNIEAQITQRSTRA